MIDEKCREEAEKALYDRDKEHAAKARAKARAKKASKLKNVGKKR